MVSPGPFPLRDLASLPLDHPLAQRKASNISMKMPKGVRGVSGGPLKTSAPCKPRKIRRKPSPENGKRQLKTTTPTSTLAIVRKGKSETDAEEQAARREELMAVSAAMMNDIFCGDFQPNLTTFPTKPRGCESRAMDFFLNFFAPAQKTLRITVNASLDNSDPLITSVFPLALHHEELFHAVIAMSLSSMEAQSYFESDGNILERPSKDIFYHRQCALSFLRHKLTPPYCKADNAALLTTTALLLLDGILGDTASLRVHCLGLRQMIDALGGIDSPKIDKLLRHFILQCDYCWALEANLPVAYGLNKLTIHNPFSAVPQAFKELDLSDPETEPLINIIARMYSWTISVSRVIEGTETLEHKGLLFSYSPFYDTTELLSILHTIETHSGDPVATALCLALVLIGQNFYGKGRFYKWYQKLRLQLTELLLQMDLCYASPADRKCLTWVWMVAAESWRICQSLLPRGHELVRSLVRQCDEADDWAQLEEILKAFLWYESLGEKWKACWEECVIVRGLEDTNSDASRSATPPSNFSTPSSSRSVLRVI